jgi:hypothetical protein
VSWVLYPQGDCLDCETKNIDLGQSVNRQLDLFVMALLASRHTQLGVDANQLGKLPSVWFMATDTVKKLSWPLRIWHWHTLNAQRVPFARKT